MLQIRAKYLRSFFIDDNDEELKCALETLQQF